uniref:Asparagine--tRNA ligase n=1 Tax=Corethron hystrix TaxID=216773 RepID=A0A7S1FM59_9STRA|mmetsp:Transcript_15119/g.33769  ORF Transcript_15119/g.33769 Transcript_15119/m.33769 type:complete len:588 (+) Transcript_15119:275-2038(+)
MTAILILSGSSEEELRSPQAIQVIATAISARVPPRISTCLSPSQSSPLSLSVPCGDGPPGTLVSVPAMLRTLHSLYYAGEDPVADAEVFAFVDHCSNELAEPLLAHDAETASQVTADAKAALEGLEKSLEGDKTFICSTPQASAADFAWGAWVEHARVLLGEALPLGERTIGWLATVMHQPSYVATKEAMKSSAEFTLPKEAASDTPSRGPDPTPQLFKRDRTRIFSVLATPPGANITVAGWARTIRKADKGRLIFIELNDGSSPQSLQCVLTKEAVEEGDNVTENFECALPVNSGGTGSSFRLTGTIVKSHGAGQAVELVATSVELLGAVYAGDQAGTKIGATFYPLSKKGHTLEHMRSVAHLRARAKVHSSAMRIRHAMAYATHRFFHENGFLYIHTPIVTCADCEGAGEQFGVTTLLSADHLSTNIKLPYVPEPKPEDSDVKKKKDKKKKKAPPIDPHAEPPVPNAVDYSGDFFGKRANLTVSGQLNVETHCMALSDVYTFGPTFRAEQSHTARHLCEFWMIEPEVAFADLEMDVNLAEDYLKYCVKYALEMCAEDLEFFENSPAGEKDLRARLRNVLDNPFKV